MHKIYQSILLLALALSAAFAPQQVARSQTIYIDSYRYAYDVAAQDYFDRAEALQAGAFDLSATNATAEESYVKEGWNEFVKVLKGETASVFVGTSSIGGDIFGTQPTPINVWTKLTEVYPLVGVQFGGITAKLKHAGTATVTNNNFVTGDYVSVGTGAGLKGGTDEYIEANQNFASPFDFGCFAYATTPPTVFGRYLAAETLAGVGPYIGSDGSTRYYSTSSTSSIINVAPGGSGLLVGVTRSTSDREFYLNSASFATSAVVDSVDRTGVAIELFRRASSGGSAYTDASLSIAGIGTSLTTAEAAYLSWCVNSLMTYFGANSYINTAALWQGWESDTQFASTFPLGFDPQPIHTNADWAEIIPFRDPRQPLEIAA